MTVSSAFESSETSTRGFVGLDFDSEGMEGLDAMAWAKATKTVFSAREIRSLPSNERIKYLASLEFFCEEASNFFMIPIFFCWD